MAGAKRTGASVKNVHRSWPVAASRAMTRQSAELPKSSRPPPTTTSCARSNSIRSSRGQAGCGRMQRPVGPGQRQLRGQRSRPCSRCARHRRGTCGQSAALRAQAAADSKHAEAATRMIECCMVPRCVSRVGRSPQTAQSGRRAMAIVRKVMSRRSNVSSWPASGSPRPAISLMASIAASEPTVEATALNTGNLRFQFGGGSG